MDELNQWGCKEGGIEYFGAFKRIYDSCTGGSVNGNGQHVEMIERRGEVGLGSL